MKKTIAEFHRRMPDGSPHTLIPKGIQVEVEEVDENVYEVTANQPITKNNSKTITVTKRELNQFI